MPRLVLATEVLDGDMTRRELLRIYRKVHRNVYARRNVDLTARDQAIAAWMWSGRTATLSGLSAAAMLGSKWVPDDCNAELVRTQHAAPAGIVAHKDDLLAGETTQLDGITCTTVGRTGFDLGRRLPFSQGLIHVEALLNANGASYSDIAAVAVQHPGARNIRRLREVLSIADAGAESPQETRVRLILIRGGLPRPVTQIWVGNRRVDMGWPEYKVGVEYDGPQHWTDEGIFGDVERLQFLAENGWRIVRVVAQHVRQHPQRIVDRAADAMYAAGWPGPLRPTGVGFLTRHAA